MNKTKEMAFKAINGLINESNVGKFIKDNDILEMMESKDINATCWPGSGHEKSGTYSGYLTGLICNCRK